METVHRSRPVPHVVPDAWQVPPLQTSPAAQTLPHVPQLRGSLARSTHSDVVPMVQVVRPGRQLQLPLPLQYCRSLH